MDELVAQVFNFITHSVAQGGYLAVVWLMAIESANLPLPSEVIMPFAGYLALEGRFSLWLVALAGGFGCTVGSLASYYLGRWGGRPLVERYGRYVLVKAEDVAWGEAWLKRGGWWSIFTSRLLPVVRTFISLPAGILRMPLVPFIVWTFIGSTLWSLALAAVGYGLGTNWALLEHYFKKFDIIVVVLLVAAVGWFLARQLRRSTHY